ncbi:hypothetical protein [Bacillus pseudomycoides]|uniref:hypothetical protein n=1 Tax=Bacillus pseudomycoides TaxID=64104 RepID=UPI000BF208CD|nr:hypothetical protein [Bacillus pseudomycoides]PEJ33170.1 hypothetical protein CN677_16115 [Bacillus pseudomycoides]PHA95728.1 hypothetical protein COE78_08720 [Bacillus pseudomycoides]PHC74057.1 hypothetical protein COF38_18035 [Bacillus pseudomycoides]
MIFNSLTDIFLHNQNSKLYVIKIPESFLKKREIYKIPKKDKIIAFLDNTLLRHGRSGIMFSESGMYWKGFGKQDNISWESLKKVSTITATDSDIKIDNKIINISFSEYPTDMFIKLIKTIIDYLNVKENYNVLHNKDEISLELEMIRNICKPFENIETANAFNVDENIETKKIDKFFKNYKISFNDKIIAQLDTTVFKGGTEGMLICLTGLYFKEKFLTVYLPWHILDTINFKLKDMNLQISSQNTIFHLQNSTINLKEFMSLIKRLQEVCAYNKISSYNHN